MLDVFRSFALGMDRSMDGHGQRTPLDKMPVLGARHHTERTIDRYGNNRQLQLVCQHEGSFLEGTHLCGERTGAFGKDYHAHSAAQSGTSLLVGVAYLAGTALVDKYLMGHLTCHSNQRYLAYITLHHPFEITAKMTIDEEDVECSLVVGNKDVRLS